MNFLKVIKQNSKKIYAARCTSSIYQRQKNISSQPVYVTETDLAHHNHEDIGCFIKVDPEIAKRLYSLNALPTSFYEKTELFSETSIMIREPALEVIHYLKQLNPQAPAIRYVLYGGNGSGKSMTLSHIVLYAYLNNWLLIHVPWFLRWLKTPKEIVPSNFREGFFDLPAESAMWLQRFKIQNENILKAKDIVTTKEYTWSKRESTLANKPLIEIIDFGLSRIKYANDAVGIVLKEIKKQCLSCKVLVAIDEVNSMFTPETIHKPCKGSTERIPAYKFSLSHQFMKLLRNDWCNAAVVTAITRRASREANKLDPTLNHQLKRPLCSSYLPRYLLGPMGFEIMDPFVPIEVPNYSEKELHSVLDYLSSKNWLQHPACNTLNGRDELKFLTNGNPGDLLKYTDSL